MAIAYEQSKSVFDTTPAGNPSSLTFTNVVKAGSLIFVGVSWDYGTSATVNPVVAGNGNIYAQILTTAQDTVTGSRTAVFFAKNVNAGSTTVTATFLGTGEQFRQFVIAEYSGVSPTFGLDQAAKTSWDGDGLTTSTGTDATVSKSITPSVNGALVVGFFADTSGTPASVAPGTNFNEREDLTDFQLEDLVQSTAAAIQAKWTIGTAGHHYHAFVASFTPIIPAVTPSVAWLRA